jgi:hypothetical protein
LGGTDGMSAELLDDFGNFAGRDALDIHLGQREQLRPQRDPDFRSLFGGVSPPACATLRPPPRPRQKTGQV